MLSLAMGLFAFLFSARAEAQGVKIHQLGLGDGDCTLIEIIDYKPTSTPINPQLDTAVILIDAQRNSDDAYFEIVDFIEKKLGPSGLNRMVIDYVILSHVHIDHYGNMENVLEALLSDGYQIDYVFDRLAKNESDIDWDLNDIDECYDELVTGRLSASASSYQKFIKDNFDGYNFPIFAGTELLENRFRNTRMLCVAGFGATINPTDGSRLFFIPKMGDYYKPKSENDLSFAFLLSYGGFRYFTGGDLGGQDHSGYANGEVPVAKYLKAKGGTNFHFCAFKVSHHGSLESTSTDFLNLVTPTLAVIPAALRSYGRSTNPLPRCVTLDNLAAAKVAKLVYTFVPQGDTTVRANYCLYRNRLHTQDVTLVVNAADVGAAVTMNLTLQGRNDRYDISGTPVLSTLQCTKVHSAGPFVPTLTLQGMQQAMDSTQTVAGDNILNLPPPRRSLAGAAQSPEVKPQPAPVIKKPAQKKYKKKKGYGKKKKKKQHNH